MSDFIAVDRNGNVEANCITVEALFDLLLQLYNLNVITAAVSYKGNAAVATDPGAQTTAAFWTVSEAGTYTHFGNVVLPANSVGIIAWNGAAFSIVVTTLVMTGYTKKYYLLNQNSTFTTGELATIQVIKDVRISYADETHANDLFVINAFAKNYTAVPTKLNYIEFKNLTTTQVFGRLFTAGEITAGYAEISLDSIVGFSGMVAKVWFDYTLTSSTGLLIDSADATAKNIIIKPTANGTIGPNTLANTNAIFSPGVGVVQTIVANDAANYTNIYRRMGFGVKLASGQSVNSVSTNLWAKGVAVRITMQVWTRAAGKLSSLLAPGLEAGDVMVQTKDLTAGVDYTVGLQYFPLTVNFTAVNYDVANPLVLLWFKAYDVSSASAASIGFKRYGSATVITDPFIRGWFAASSDATDTGGTILDPTNSLSSIGRTFSGLIPVNNIGIQAAQIAALQASLVNIVHLREVLSLTNVVTGLSNSVTGSIIDDGGITYPINQTLAVSASTTGSTTINPFNLVYDLDTLFEAMAGPFIPYRNITNAVVTRLSDSVVLAAGVDYFLHPNGRLVGLKNIANFNVSVTFNYAYMRYDLIQMNTYDHTISVKVGTNRAWDIAEYVPKPDPGNQTLFTLRIVANTVESIETWKFKNLIKRDCMDDFNNQVLINRSALKKTFGKIARGVAIKIAGYGDSRTSIQLGGAGSLPYTPNGTGRDRWDRYLALYPTDTIAALPKYDFGDGAGAVHAKICQNWQLVDAVTKSAGVAPTYLNFGIGSTTTENSVDNGLWPARIAQVVAAAPDLMILSFGMNEEGQTFTLANTISIIQQLQAVGTEVIVVPPYRRNEDINLVAMRETHANLKSAAAHTGSAFVPYNWILDDAFIAGISLSKADLCQTNFLNHEGIYEHAQEGKFMCLVVGL